MSKLGKTNYVTQQQLKVIRGARGVGHIHSNKDTLDQITPEFFANMSETVSLAHSHNNRVAIDRFSYDPETNTIYVGDEDDPVNFAAFGDVGVGGLPGGSTPTGAQYLYQLTDVPDYRNDSTKVGKVLKVGSNNTIVWGDGASSFGQISGSPYDNTGLATALNGKADSSAIADMATKTWVNGRGFLTEITSSMVITALGNTAVAKATDADTLDGQHASHFASASDLETVLALLNKIDSWIGYDEDNNAIYIKKDADNNARNFYTFGDVAVGGPGSGGGGGASYLYQLTDVPDYRNDSTKVGKVLKVGSNNTIVWGDSASSFSQLSGSPYDNTSLATALNGKADSSAIADMATKTWVKSSIPALATIGGRVYGTGDDEGIIISKASNGYAGLILGSPSGVRSIFYLSSGNPFWRYNNGTTSYNISHPAKSGTIALTSDIPIDNSELTNGAGYITSSGSCAYATSAGNADTLDGQHASYFATASSLGNYQPLATAINTGNIASQRVRALVSVQTTPTTGGTDLNTVLAGGAVVGNYGSGTYWAHGPAGMTYGSVIQINSNVNNENTLALQVAWDINHNVATSTRGLWFRASNNLGWQNDWKEIYHSGNLTAATLGALTTTAAAATYVAKAGDTMTGALTMPSGVGIKWGTAHNSDWSSAQNSGIRILNTVGVSATGAPGNYSVGLSVQGYYGFQLACNNASNNFTMRSTSNGTASDYKEWVTLYHSGNCNNTSTPWICSMLNVGASGSSSSRINTVGTMELEASNGLIRIGAANRYLEVNSYYNGGRATSISNIANYPIYINASGHSTTPQICLAISGNVGVGTPTPPAKLSVFGDTYFQTCVTGANIYIDSPTYTGAWNGGLHVYEQGTKVGSAINWYANSSGIGYIRIGNFGSTYDNPSIYITSDGNVMIGAASNMGQKLYVAGNIVVTGDVAVGSDARWKHQIMPVNNGLVAIMRLKPSEWLWNSDSRKGSGLIAQEVQPVLPHLVKTDNEGYLHLNYEGLHAYEISAIQSHENEIERLRKKVAELEQEVKRLRS